MNAPPFVPISAIPAPADDADDKAQLAARLRAIGHPVRLTVLETLSGQDRCVCGDIVRALPLAQSTVSQHLKVLLDAGLIRSRTEGQRSGYCLDREALSALKIEIDSLFAALLAPASDCCAPQDD
ncbi:winged helix-turn-helix transcriptional regulator [Xanthobacter dioxanivorans]|uniref:Winged helix-turn-helix transcriptional regulator n=1 Tax=Xanthobacter dioxanivorans TaxID=2528964 RepID=A0A974SGT7_9HYPH|nr:metalloregulator ArsR/SmtB family transcription factor [Xanthobacter dioxanivorans]QRG05606.1 winged helix-turn-helix transcriptional regulator [Xanthobacter dioxanivorans]